MQELPTFVINLEHDTQRREHMQRQLETLGIAAEFVPAVDGRKLSDADRAANDHKRTLKIYGTGMMDTEIGCYLSHYRIYERMVNENISMALILEDDIDIDPALPAILHELVADPDPEWLVVRFESQRGRVLNPRKLKERGRCVKTMSNSGLYKLGVHVLGFGGYLIRREGAERMIKYGRRIFMPIDQTMDRFWENGIAPYIVRPLPIKQKQDFESRIGSRPKGRHLSQPLWVRAWRRWQRLLDGFRKRLFITLNP